MTANSAVFSPVSAGFLLDLLFNPEDGGDMLLLNTGKCTVLQDGTPQSKFGLFFENNYLKD
jgi:hypothetical protein